MATGSDPRRPAEESGEAFGGVVNAFYLLALGASNERCSPPGGSGRSCRSLPVSGVDVLAADLDEAYTAGIQAALSSRLDLMNALRAGGGRIPADRGSGEFSTRCARRRV